MITSCDAYKDCWKPMVYSLDKYWPDCEYPRYIVTNYEEDNSLPNTSFIKVGDDKRSWCTLAAKGLEGIDADYIIFFQEDYWLGRKVNNEAIKAHVKYMVENDVDYLKIQDDIRRDKYRIDKTDYCLNPINIRYAFNTAIAIWRKEAIPQLLPDGWSGWVFERRIVPFVKEKGIVINSQALYSKSYQEKGIEPIREDAIVRGVWTDSAIAFLRENGMDDVISKRDKMGPITAWLYRNSPHRQSPFRWPFWGALKILKDLKVNW